MGAAVMARSGFLNKDDAKRPIAVAENAVRNAVRNISKNGGRNGPASGSRYPSAKKLRSTTETEPSTGPPELRA